jgi:hypothetical protein
MLAVGEEVAAAPVDGEGWDVGARL